MFHRDFALVNPAREFSGLFPSLQTRHQNFFVFEAFTGGGMPYGSQLRLQEMGAVLETGNSGIVLKCFGGLTKGRF